MQDERSYMALKTKMLGFNLFTYESALVIQYIEICLHRTTIPSRLGGNSRLHGEED